MSVFGFNPAEELDITSIARRIARENQASPVLGARNRSELRKRRPSIFGNRANVTEAPGSEGGLTGALIQSLFGGPQVPFGAGPFVSTVPGVELLQPGLAGQEGQAFFPGQQAQPGGGVPSQAVQAVGGPATVAAMSRLSQPPTAVQAASSARGF